MNGDNSKADPERYRRSVELLTGIFRGISEKVNEVSVWRCPYKNAQDRCTAEFVCRNQNRAVSPGELYCCESSDSLGYRSAWETGGS